MHESASAQLSSFEQSVIDPSALGALLEALVSRGYEVLGAVATPTAVVFAPMASPDALPAGCASEQAPGRYRLRRSGDGRLFAYGPTADSLKRLLHPPTATLWRATRASGALQFEPAAEPPPRVALIGARPCDLAGVARLDQVFLKGPFRDPIYAARRSALLLVVANCTEPAGTCFCASMGTGPAAGAGYDLAFTELPPDDHGPHRLLFTAGSNEGGRLLAALPGRAPLAADRDAERQLLDRAATRMGRAVETAGLAAALTAAAEHPEWDDVAHRCLSCANCTMVCPTCFCSTVEDHSTLSGREVERRRRWDSCFTAEFSYIHGGSIRPSTRARYRQWLTHKFATSVEQFGQPSCVGCGRCITWCPGGIDATEEIHRLRGPRIDTGHG